MRDVKWCLLVAGGFLLLSAINQEASAATEVFAWTLTSPNFGAYDTSPVVGSGTITATEGTGGAWAVDSITGSFTDLALVGTPTYSVTGVGPEVSNIYGETNDNLIYPSGPAFLDTSGVSFETTTGSITLSLVSGDSYNEDSHLGLGTGTFTLAATPLPAAFPLFASGLGGLGLLGWRRKRKAIAD